MKNFLAIAALAALSLPLSAERSLADNYTTSRPDGHAPIGVMADHTHEAGEVMLSYRYMRMEMQGNRDGNHSVSTTQVLEQFPVAPTRMSMDMHMLGAMWAPTNEWTVALMAPWIRLEMDHKTRSGGSFTTDAEGWGDLRATLLRTIWEQGSQSLHAGFGLSAPTGSVNQRGTPMGPKAKLPYPMQLGSGTWDLHPSLTYNGQTPLWSWGAQARGTIRPGTNSERYTLGDRVGLGGWLARRCGSFSVSARIDGELWGDIDGADPELNPAMVPTARTDLRGGRRLDVGTGINWAPNGKLAGHRLAAEFMVPVAQDLDGPQLETDWSLTSGWQYTFN